MVIRDKNERRKYPFIKRYSNPLSVVGDVNTKNIYQGFSDKVVGFTLIDLEAIAESISKTHLEVWKAFKNLEKSGYIKHGQRPVDTNLFLIFKKDIPPEDTVERMIYEILLDI